MVFDNQLMARRPFARNIVAAILRSLDEFSSDGMFSKFFLSDYFLEPCRSMAKNFASNYRISTSVSTGGMYSQANTTFLFACLWGVQTYLKERLFVWKKYTYAIPLTKRADKAYLRALEDVAHNRKISRTAQRVFLYYLTCYFNCEAPSSLMLPKRKENKRKLYYLLATALLWGYHLAREMVTDDAE